jgi:hypothetical protein
MTINAEARLKKLARESGYAFHKSRKAESSENFGGYMLTEIATNTLVAGPKYQLSLQDVARELQRLHVLGRK